MGTEYIYEFGSPTPVGIVYTAEDDGSTSWVPIGNVVSLDHTSLPTFWLDEDL